MTAIQGNGSAINTSIDTVLMIFRFSPLQTNFTTKVNIFFVTFGTAFVGSVFGSLSTLRNDINDLRRYYAWKRRDVSRQLIKELQVNDLLHPPTIPPSTTLSRLTHVVLFVFESVMTTSLINGNSVLDH
jgi:hypothetical protein